MALSDKLTDNPRKPTGLPCSIGELEQSLPPSEAAAFRAMMYQLGWSAARIYDALAAEGHVVGKQTVQRHRSRACRCFQ